MISECAYERRKSEIEASDDKHERNPKRRYGDEIESFDTHKTIFDLLCIHVHVTFT